MLAELAELIEYRSKYLGKGPGVNEILALGLSSRKNLCVHPRVAGGWRTGEGWRVESRMGRAGSLRRHGGASLGHLGRKQLVSA